MRQLSSEHWHAVLDLDENSVAENGVAVPVQHLSGNMHSRWGHFLQVDGESADRDRYAEFTDTGLTPEQLWDRWNAGWLEFYAIPYQEFPSRGRRAFQAAFSPDNS